ncbi:MAG: ABC transporter ATP-binding protein [Planctomycetota bacterium]
MTSSIVCRGVRKTYRTGGRSVEALRGVDIDIPGPGFYGIMGRSGSGKSTLLHVLGALDAPDAGEIEVGGTRIDTLSERDATVYRRTGVGVVFQRYNLLATMTAVENVELPGVLAGEKQSTLRPRAEKLLDELGLSDRAGHRPEAMSGGEQQRVAIARALLFEPPVLLADEPTGNLDSRTAEALWGLLARVAGDHDTTVVMVTHEPAAAAHCSRVLVVSDGLIADDFETEGLDAGGVASRAERALDA